MGIVSVEGVDIDFPYIPYECQTKYMEHVVKSLKLKCDAALESPTGTGKTLSLLCSVLAWLQQEKLKFTPNFQTSMSLAKKDSVMPSNLFPKIYYCSRTHSQLAQVVRELNKTVYKGVKTSVLASRDQLCIHERISKETNNRVKSMMCRSAVSKRTCHYYNKWNSCGSEDLKGHYETSGNALDIEDLLITAKKHSHCPYFQAKNMKEKAELILLPYDYLINPELRKIHEIDLAGNVVIFDEGHNLEGVCEQNTSVDLSTTDIAMCIKELQQSIEIMQEETEVVRTQMDNSIEIFGKTKEKTDEPIFEVGTAAIVLQMLFTLEQQVEYYYKDEMKKSRNYRDISGKIYPGAVMYELLESAQFTFDKANEITTILRKAADYLHEKTTSNSSKANETRTYLHKFDEFLSTVFSSHPVYDNKSNPLASQLTFEEQKSQALFSDFKLYMYKEKNGNTDQETNKIFIKYWCFSPSIAMKSLKQRGVRSVIVTSGTLAPLDNFTASLGLDFGCILENSHAASNKQVVCGIVKKGKGSGMSIHNLDGKQKNRANEDYLLSIAHSLRDLAKGTPQGILVFFPTYSMMNDTISAMHKQRKHINTVWDEISIYKEIVIEPKARRDLALARMEFSNAVKTKNGAIFLAVCKGKVSEGIDFADADSRAVVVVGIPYPPAKDPRIVMKKAFLDEQREKNRKLLSGHDWYRMEAFRSVNQAIGRVLRHVNDFGVIALLDSRYANAPFTLFSSWLRPSVQHFDLMENFNKMSERFFTERKVDILKSIENLKTLSLHEASRNSKVRTNNVQKDYCVNYLAEPGEIEILSAPNSNVESTCDIQCLSNLEESQDVVKRKRSDKVVVPSDFGSITSEAQQPLRKKIRLTSRPAIDLIVDDKDKQETRSVMRSNSLSDNFIHANTRPTNSIQSSSTQLNESVSDSTSNNLKRGIITRPNLIQITSMQLNENLSIHEILQLDNDNSMKLLRSSLERPKFKNVIGAIKGYMKYVLREKTMDFQQVFDALKQLLLPGHPKLLIAASKFLSSEDREHVVEECTKLLNL